LEHRNNAVYRKWAFRVPTRAVGRLYDIDAAKHSLFKINVAKAGSATYMPHSQQRHAYKNNTHKIRRNLKTKYNDNKKEKENSCSAPAKRALFSVTLAHFIV